MVKQLVRSSPFWMALAFLVTLTSTYLIVSSVSRTASEASVPFNGNPTNTTPSNTIDTPEAANQSATIPIQYCSNNVYTFDGRTACSTCPCDGPPGPPPKPPRPNPGPGTPGGPGCNAGCGGGGPVANGLPALPELSNTGFDGTNAAQQFGSAQGLPSELLSQTGSAIDNASFNYIHVASDYQNGTTDNHFASPRLTRFFRSREASTIGSFGVSGFCTYDIKLKLFTTNTYGSGGYGSGGYGGSSSAFIVPDASTSDSQRPYVFDPNSPAGRAHRGKLAFFDTNNNPVTPTNGTVPRTVRYVEFTAEDRTIYRFETLQTAANGAFQTDRATDARLIRMQDKNGYGTTITYPTLTANQVQTSYDLQWQINQVTGDDGRTLAFTYHNVQYGGRWVVSQIAFPNGANATYAYSGTRLTTVTGSDGTVSTFTYGGLYKNYGTGIVSSNPANGTLVAETIEFADPAAAQGHQRKTIILTLANLSVDPNQPFYTQASQLIRSVINDQNEVTYHNYPFANQSSNSWTNVYEGQGKMKRVINHMSTGIGVQFYADGWQQANGTITGNIESSPQTYSTRSPAPSSITEANGEVKTYTYLPYDFKSGWWVSQVSHSDGTTETFQYDTEYRVTRQKDRLGNVTKHTYDARGNRLTTQVGLVDNGMGGETATAEAATTTYEYYPTGHAHQYLLKSVTDPLGNVTDYEYNTNHRLSKVISPPDTVGGARAETEYLYDTAGRLSTVIGAGGWGVTYTYDTRNRVTKLTHADNSTERYFYGTGTESNLLVKVKDRAGTVTKYEYDLAGRRIKTISSYATMDLADNETLITDPALKVEEVCTYIPGTELKASCVRAGEKTTYVYDYRHRLVETKTQPRVGKILASKTVFKDNKLFSTEDAYGRKTFYAYRASDAALVRTIQATVPSVSYADFAAVLAATRAAPTTPNPTSLITDYTLDNSGRTVATIDPLGITHTVAYDSRGRTTEQIAASGTSVAAKTKTIYDLASHPVEVQYPRYFDSTDTNGFNKSRTTMTYTGRGLLASRTESPGTAEVATESYTYNIEGRQLTRVDARGFTWTTVWNTCCGRQQGSYDPYGHGTIVNVDNLGRATHTATVSNVTAHSANYKDPIDAQTFGETTTKYDTRGRVTARTVWLTPLGQIDPNNVPIYTGPPVNDSANPPAAPYGLTTTYAYDDDLDDNTGLDATFAAHLAGLSLGADSDGSAVLTTNPAGERTLAIRDGLGRGVRSVQLDGSNAALASNTSTFDTVVTISGYGDVLETAFANALGNTNRSRTDGADRTIQSLDATNAMTTFTYDAVGSRLSVRDPNNVGQDCTYDAIGRNVTCTNTNGTTKSRTYNLHGKVTTQIDGKGHSTSLSYDSRGHRTSLTDRINATTTWTFDAAGNQLSMTDAESQATTYTYDNAGRQITIQWPDHVSGQNLGDANYGIEATAYDAAGREFSKTNQLGDTITSVYDLGSRMTSREYRTKVNSPSGSTSSVDTFTYDAASRILTGIKGLYSNTVTMTYDQGGRKATEALTIAGQTYTVGTSYDTAGRISQLIYPDGSALARTYDSRNLLSTITLGGTNIDSRSYDAGGRLSVETLGNDQVITHTYTTGDNTTLAISNSAIGTYTYSWDANRNKISETITGVLSGYGFSVPIGGYDDQDRLTVWNRADGNRSQSWALSPVGDWNTLIDTGTTQNRTHGPTHELTAINGTSLNYDNRGNVAQDESGRTNEWDEDGLLTMTTVPVNSSTGIPGTHYYHYDALGRRVRKVVNAGATIDTIYVHTDDIVACEYSAFSLPSTPLRVYVNASYTDEPMLMIDYTASGDSGSGVAELLYYHRNQQYCITALTNNVGSVVERYAYTAYGEPSIFDSSGSSIVASRYSNCYLYTARTYDSDTGWYYFRDRMYDGRKGRFLSRDLLGYPDGASTYSSYMGISAVDPTGQTFTLIGGNWVWARPAPIFEPVTPVEPILRPDLRIYNPPVETVAPRPGFFFPPGYTVPIMPHPPGLTSPNPDPFPGFPPPVPPGAVQDPDLQPDTNPNARPWECPETESDCSPKLLDFFRRRIKRCKDDLAGKSCNDRMDDIDLMQLANEFGHCAYMRQKREEKCYRGGNLGHIWQINAWEAHRQRCLWYIRNKPAPPRRGRPPLPRPPIA